MDSITSLFTYGSLMCTDIMYRVAGLKPKHSKAILKDHFRSAITEKSYPGIIYREGYTVPGVVYFNLSGPAIMRLDSFEGEYYIRQEVNITLSNDQVMAAMTYIIRPQYENILTGEPWSYEDFLAQGKRQFIDNYDGFESL